VAAGVVPCARCGELIGPGAPWDLGHLDGDRSRYAGPEHSSCNRSTARHRAVRVVPSDGTDGCRSTARTVSGGRGDGSCGGEAGGRHAPAPTRATGSSSSPAPTTAGSAAGPSLAQTTRRSPTTSFHAAEAEATRSTISPRLIGAATAGADKPGERRNRDSDPGGHGQSDTHVAGDDRQCDQRPQDDPCDRKSASFIPTNQGQPHTAHSATEARVGQPGGPGRPVKSLRVATPATRQVSRKKRTKPRG
jgi:hypothetical protein